jgi:hypothetical protein
MPIRELAKRLAFVLAGDFEFTAHMRATRQPNVGNPRISREYCGSLALTAFCRWDVNPFTPRNVNRSI